MLKWMLLIVFIISGGILGYMYVQLEQTDSSVATSTALIANSKAARIFDGFNDGVHRYDGQIRLPHSCYSVAMSIKPDTENPGTVIISLTTTDKMLDLSLCVQLPTVYPFEEVYDAPADTVIRLMLNGREVPVHMVKTNWVSPKGNILNSTNANSPAK